MGTWGTIGAPQSYKMARTFTIMYFERLSKIRVEKHENLFGKRVYKLPISGLEQDVPAPLLEEAGRS